MQTQSQTVVASGDANRKYRAGCRNFAMDTIVAGGIMKRYLILNGDKTTANGTVQATPTSIKLSGQDVAHEGDDVACPACNSTGKIKCDGPRQLMTAPDGRHAVLSDDLCMCKCDPPPKLVASQNSMSVQV
jgi:uncharacterized Zn-binding protein involved in type VI secretion